MDALVMAGGRGTRLEADVEKPLFEVAGTPIVDRVLDALHGSAVEDVYVATSPATPATREHVDVPCIHTPGDGYVPDLDAALADDRLRRPVLTVTGDLPLLEGPVIDRVLGAHEGGSLTVCVPRALKEALGASVDETHASDPGWVPSGLNVVGEGADDALRTWDARLAVDVDRPRDASIATRLVTRESINRDYHP